MDVLVDFFGLCLQESDDEFVPETWPDGWQATGAPFLTSRDGRIDIVSGGHTHTAVLDAEIWDGEPPADRSRAWEAQGQAQILSHSGELAVWSMGGPMKDYLELGSPGTRWTVRVYCSGREEVRRLAELGVPAGVERYLVQFWPADD